MLVEIRQSAGRRLTSFQGAIEVLTAPRRLLTSPEKMLKSPVAELRGRQSTVDAMLRQNVLPYSETDRLFLLGIP
jgi:hypothetical protein